MLAIGATVKTFTGRIGEVLDVRTDGTVRVRVPCGIPDEARPKLPPPAIFVNITYLVTDLTQVEGSERE